MTTESLDDEFIAEESVEEGRLSLRGLPAFVRDCFYQWTQRNAFVYAAALAFYTIFSIVPLVVFIVGIAGQVAGAEAFEQRIVSFIARQVGAVPADFVGEIVVEGNANSQSALATGLGLLFLIWGASTIFHSLQNSINSMYGLPEEYRTFRHGVLDYAITRLLSAFVVILLGFIFLLMLAANIFFTALPQTRVEAFFADLPWTEFALRRLVTPLLTTLIIVAMYKWLPGGKLRWRDVLPGSILTVALIAIGNRAVGFYLDRIFRATLYGASGTVFLFLIWIYYINLILLFGAKFVALYAERFGKPITPKARLRVSRGLS